LKIPIWSKTAYFLAKEITVDYESIFIENQQDHECICPVYSHPDRSDRRYTLRHDGTRGRDRIDTFNGPVFIHGSTHSAGHESCHYAAAHRVFAVYNYYRTGHVNLKYAVVIAIMFTIGAYAGSKLSLVIPTNTLKKIFSVLLILVAIKMFLNK
jgi:hypothetical protein